MPDRRFFVVSVLSLCVAAACSSQRGPGAGEPAAAEPAASEASQVSTPSPEPSPQAPNPPPEPHMAMARASDEPTAPPEGEGARAALTRVDDASAVCMVNNTYMGRPQIPVVVEGRTYFGCCEMCKGRLERDASARYATDPVSGRQVDKAAAVIGRDAENRVLYFETEATYGQYAGG